MEFFMRASDLAACGLHVFPVNAAGVPAIANWRNSASTDLAVLSMWDRYYPGAGVAVALGDASGVVVVAVTDPRGSNTFAKFAAEGREMPPCPISTHPAGGHAFWLRHVHGLRPAKDEREIAPGVTVWGDGERIAAPEGVRQTWRPSTWIIPPWDVPPPAMPVWLLASITERLGYPPPAKVDPQSPKAANANRRGWFYE